MKKVVMTMGAFFALSVATAQGGYASLSVGYAGGNTGIGYATEQLTDTTSRTSLITGSYGSGIPINLSGGFMFNENFGAELGFTYLLGTTVVSSTSTSLNGDNSKTSSNGSQMRIIPQLVVSSGSSSAIEVYAKAGLLLPVGGSTSFKQEFVNSGIASSTEGTTTGKFSLGLTGSVGASYGLSDNLSIFGELQGVSLNINANTSTITSSKINGTEGIDADTPVVLTHTEYVSELSTGDNPNVTDSDYSTTARKELTGPTNYNSIGINIGIKFKF